MAVRRDAGQRVVAFRRLLPALRRAAAEVAHAGELHGEYTVVPTAQGDCELALHRAGRPRAPVVVELHGGGFAIGDAAANDAIRELLSKTLDCTVVGVGYCLAPEHPYPQAVEQIDEVLAYLAGRSGEWGLDPSRVALMGFSAGANLATVTARRALARGERRYRLVAEILHYPFLDAVAAPASKEPQPWDIPVEMMAVFNDLYAPEELRRDPGISPVYTAPEQLVGLPPTLIVAAGRDTLRGEARVYAAQLEGAGVSVVWQEMPHAHHGYVEQWLGADRGRSVLAAAQQRDLRSQAEASEAIKLTVRFLAERFNQ